MSESPLSKFAQTIYTPESELDFLKNLSKENLEFLQTRVNHAILEEQAGVWEPIARVSKYIPNFLNAKVSEDVLGPQITANITYHVPTKDALSIASYFSTKFFCDVLENIIPEKIQRIIQESPMELMRKAVNELRTRKNYFLIGNLIDYTPIPSVHKISLEVSDQEMIIILDHIEYKNRLAELLDLYEEAKILGITKASLISNKFEILKEIFKHASDKAKQRLKSILSGLSDEDKDRLGYFQLLEA